MKKVSLVVMEKYREDSLKKLREAGVLHLEQKKVSSETVVKLTEKKARADAALSLLESYKKRAAALKKISPQTGTAAAGTRRRAVDFVNSEGVPFSAEGLEESVRKDLVAHVLDLGESRKNALERIAALTREKNRIEGWGSFSPGDLQLLKDNGIVFRFYVVTPRVLASLTPDIRYFVTVRNNIEVRVAVLDGKIPGVKAFVPGEHSLDEINGLISDAREQVADIEKQLVSICSRKASIEKEAKTLRRDIEFQIANSGMKTLKDAPAETTVSWISGFVPCSALGTLKHAATENGWALALEDPAPDDMPPTLLENKAPVNFMKPLFSFLGTTPGYREFDISAPYLVFFSLFFAMIFGDAGYGLLLLAAFVTLGIRFKKKDGKIPDAIKLFILLASCTIVWGSITGAWFAIPQKNLPVFLTALIIPPFNNSGPLQEFPLFLRYVFRLPAEIPKDGLKTRWCIQFLCFSVAVIQLTLARATRVKRLLPSLLAVAQAGWFLVMAGLFFVVLSIMLKMPFASYVPYIIGAGVVLIVVFGEQKGGNFFINVAKSLGGLFSLFLKLVSCFADILSYIRLFAVGLAGAMIGQVFNSMAVPSGGLGSFGLGFIVKLVLAVLVLAFGHGLNLALTAMSVVVHGVRLNLLEFAGNHLEMEWSGYEYNPFALKQ